MAPEKSTGMSLTTCVSRLLPSRLHLTDIKDKDKAPVYMKVIQLQEKALGPEHPVFGRCLKSSADELAAAVSSLFPAGCGSFDEGVTAGVMSCRACRRDHRCDWSIRSLHGVGNAPSCAGRRSVKV